MITVPAAPSWKLTSPSALLAFALVAFLFLLSALAAFDPVAAADGFGLPVTAPDALPWLRIKAGRDLGLGLMLLTVLLLRQPRVFGAMSLVSVVIPLVDAVTVMSHGARSIGYALSVHGSAVVYGLLLGAWLLRSNATAPRERTA
jgi:hypothetical protein